MAEVGAREGGLLPESGIDLRRLTPIRRVVARRMTEAALTIPAVTLHRSVDFAALLSWREAAGRRVGRKPSIDSVLAALVGRTLAELDLLNGSWVADLQAVQVHQERNIAVAVDTPNGLSVVVLRNADRRDPFALEEDLLAMVERARGRQAQPSDVGGATFTISNLGGLGVDWFNPIITPPQAAVLGVGAVHAGPAAERPATLSLTFDHRVADGADAARFLDRLAGRIAAAAEALSA